MPESECLIKIQDVEILIERNNIFNGRYSEYRGIFDIDQHLDIDYPWIKNVDTLLGYLKSMLIEEYLYEIYAKNHGLTKRYVWNKDGNMLFDDQSALQTDRDLYYLNTGLYSSNLEEDIYVRLKIKKDENEQTNAGVVNNSYVLDFSSLPEEVSSQDSESCINVFKILPIKRTINLDRLVDRDINPHKIGEHILKSDNHLEERIGRLPQDYQDIYYNNNPNEDERLKYERLKEKLENDIRYSIIVFRNCPALAVPLSLNADNVDKLNVDYVGQFAIPLFRSEEHTIYAALPLSCIDSGNAISRYKKLRDEANKLDESVIEEIVPYLSYLYCSYNCKTILTLDMVRKDSLFPLHGHNENPLLWFNIRYKKGHVTIDQHNGYLSIRQDNPTYYYPICELNVNEGDEITFKLRTDSYNRHGKLKWKPIEIYHIAANRMEDEQQSESPSNTNEEDNGGEASPDDREN